ncbi:blast:BTB/POZ domain-containing protein 9 [Drosophila guanche]|uniref:Blast:BTB/POZ domain-containing protein 9 n=1 Tax=Drosophila guanche TaxID=7266 RepID=A0A3B0JSS7_DROGU|nr:blast:BTB/POZ domain-containing protein 9 [Drosophila guanche]
MSTQDNNAAGIHSIAMDMGRLFMQELYSDVVFLVEDQRLPAHRVVLAARCEYFRAMLFGDMAESKKHEIQLEVPLEAFKSILEYLYLDKLPFDKIGVDKTFEVLHLAHLYGLEYLQTAVEKYLQQALAVSNVCMILNAARLYDMPELIKKCYNFIEKNQLALLQSDSIQTLSKEAFEDLLRQDNFFAPEVELFRSICKWRENKPSEDSQTLLSLVRLPLMSIHELLHVVRPSGIFKLDDIVDAIDKVNIGKNLPYRATVLPRVNVASKNYASYIRADTSEIVIQLKKCFKINSIQVSSNFSAGEYELQVSLDETHWDSVGRIRKEHDSPIMVRFMARPASFIRVAVIPGLGLRPLPPSGTVLATYE